MADVASDHATMHCVCWVHLSSTAEATGRTCETWLIHCTTKSASYALIYERRPALCMYIPTHGASACNLPETAGLSIICTALHIAAAIAAQQKLDSDSVPEQGKVKCGEGHACNCQ